MMSVPIPISVFFFFNDTATTEIYTLSLHDALPIYLFYLQMNDIAVVGSSPERLVKVQGRDAFYRPIAGTQPRDRKSTRLNSSHLVISYAVFCLKKKTSSPRYESPPSALWHKRHTSC